MKNKRTLKAGTYSFIVSAIVIVAIIVVNLFVRALPTSVTKPDLTDAKILSISDDSVDYLKGLDCDVELYLIAETGSEDVTLSEMLERYAALSSHVSFATIDPNVHPTFVSNYTDDDVASNSVIVTSELRSRVVPYDNVYMYEPVGYEGQYYTQSEYSYYQQMSAQYGQSFPATRYFMAESQITGAVDYVVTDDLPVLYILGGHGESAFDQNFRKITESENIIVKDLQLLSGETTAVPEDASSVFINSPQSDIAKAEAEALIAYLDRGGNIILTTGFDIFGKEETPNLNSVCAHMGLEEVTADIESKEPDNIVFEGDESFYTGAPYALLPQSTGQGVMANVGGTYTMLVYSHAIAPIEGAKGVDLMPLLSTSAKSYIVSYWPKNDNGEFAENTEGADLHEQSYAVAYESVLVDDDNNSGGRLVWVGSPLAFDSNYALQGNVLVFHSILSTMCEKTSSVALIGKSLASPALVVSEADSTFWTAIFCIVIPVATLAAGVVVWILRRRR